MDSIYGGLISFIMGDALGAPFEFNTDPKKEWNTSFIYSPFPNSQLGQYTDDSELTITLMRHLIENRGIVKTKLIKDYQNWANSNTFDVGLNLKFLFQGGYSFYDYESRFNTWSDEQKEAKLSNGALMRCWPLAFSIIYKRLAIVDCMLTNPNCLACMINIAYLKLIRLACKRKQQLLPQQIIYKLISCIENNNFFTDLLEFFDKQKVCECKNKIINLLVVSFDYLGVENIHKVNYPVNFSGSNKGYCLAAFWIAIVSFINFNNYFDAMEWIIKNHPDSDTDTNAAIAGAVLGSYYGFNKLTQSSTFAKNTNCLINLQSNSRSCKYRINDFYDLCNNFYILTNAK
jgi:ADP-ribosylglycohydrolase